MSRRRVPPLAKGLLALAVLLLAARLALDPLVTWRTRVALDGLEGMRGRFSDVEVRVRDLSYAIDDLRIEKISAGGASVPFFSVERARFGLYWRQLLGGDVVARVDLLGPRLNLLQAGSSDEREVPESRGQEAEETPVIARALERLAPFRIDRAQIKDGTVAWIDAREHERPALRVHGIEATLENFATRPALAKDEPTVLALRGTVQRTGRLSLFATADPLAKAYTFAGQARLEGFHLSELGELLEAKQGVIPDEGVADVSLRVRAERGRLSGGVRPILKDPGLKAADPGLGSRLKALLGDVALEIFSDDVPGRDAVATTIPIVGTVEGPSVQLVPTILGVIRNGFVRGLADSLAGLPPPKAADKEGVLEQARRALSSKRGNQPRAQPEAGEK